MVHWWAIALAAFSSFFLFSYFFLFRWWSELCVCMCVCLCAVFWAHFTAFSWVALHCHSEYWATLFCCFFFFNYFFSSTSLNSALLFCWCTRHCCCCCCSLCVCGLEAFKVNEKQSSVCCVCCTFLSSCLYKMLQKAASFSAANLLLGARSRCRLFSLQCSRFLWVSLSLLWSVSASTWLRFFGIQI